MEDNRAPGDVLMRQPIFDVLGVAKSPEKRHLYAI
jgi:hypothetical protein